MCPGSSCCGHPTCTPVWVSNNGPHTDWAYNGVGHHFRAHEDRTVGGRVVHTHEAGTGGFVNMRYESSGGRQQWVIDATSAPAPAPVFQQIPCRPLPTPAPVSVSVPALVPVTTTTHKHTHTSAPTMCAPVASFCSWIKPDANKIAAEAKAAAAKRDAAAKELAEAKAHYESILAKIHEGKDDEWARYWADLARYYRELGHQTEAKAVREKRLGPFDINNFWGWPKS